MSSRGVAMVLVVAVAAAFACGCERADPAPAPEPPAQAAPRVQLKLRYAAKTEDASDGTNRTYFSIVEDDSLFIVADTAPGGAGDASRLVADAMSPAPPSACFAARVFVPALTMPCALDHANAALLAANVHLRASLAAVAIHDDVATIATAGDATVLILHHDSLTVLAPARGPLDGADQPPLALRRVHLQAGDTIAVVNRPVVDALDMPRLRHALDAAGPTIHDLETSLGQLLDDAKQPPDHPALSAILVRAVEPNAP